MKTMKFNGKVGLLPALLTLLLPSVLAFAPTALADDAKNGGDEDSQDEGASDEDADRWTAVVGGDVYTGLGDVLRGATVLAKNGVIEEIGYNVYLPDDTETVDARGMRVYPGLVALSATSRVTSGSFGAQLTGAPRSGSFDASDLAGAPSARSSGDSGQYGSAQAPGAEDEPTADDDAPKRKQRTELEDSFDPFSSYLVLALATGITTAQQGNSAVKLRRGELADVEMRSNYTTAFAYTSRNPTGKIDLRTKFREAQNYLREYREWEVASRSDKELKEPSKKGIDTRVVSVLRGEQRALFQANDRNDLLAIARLAQDFGFRPVIQGCIEGWTVADELGRAGALAIIVPRQRRDRGESLVRPGGSSIENAAILHRAGVQVAIAPSSGNIDLGGETGRDLMHLPIEAGFAVRGGLPEDAALAGITIVAARLMGVDDRVGSLEVGKDCDLVVTDGDILHYETFVQYAVVAGKQVYDKEEELYFAHIRPRPEEETAGLDVPPDSELLPVEEDQPEDAEDDDEDDEDGDEGDGDDDSPEPEEDPDEDPEEEDPGS